MSIKNKAHLSWNLKDYLKAGEEPPACVLSGKTEGEIMEKEDIINWANETIRFLSVFREEYPHKFELQYNCYLSDLDYLTSLGKITSEQCKSLQDKENLYFGQK